MSLKNLILVASLSLLGGLALHAQAGLTLAAERPAANGTERTNHYWTGAASTSWNYAGNWNPAYVPNSDSDVCINPNLPYYPRLSNLSPTVHTLWIAEGASLTLLTGGNLHVSDWADIQGQLNISAAVDLDVEGNINWFNGSSANISNSSAEIYCGGNMFFYSGSNVQLLTGYLQFDGNTDTQLVNYSANTRLNTLRVMKTDPGILSISSSCTSDLIIRGNFNNYEGSETHCHYAGNLFLWGNLRDYNTTAGRGLRWGSGTLILGGNNQELRFDGPDAYLANLSVSCLGTASLATNAVVRGNLSLDGGVFNAAGFTLDVGGNWTNNACSGAFAPGTGTVVFNKALGYQDVDGETTFYNLTDAHSGDYLRIRAYVNVLGTFTANHWILFNSGANLNNVTNSNSNALIVFSYVVGYTINSYTGGGTLKTQAGCQLTILDLTQPGIHGYWNIEAGNVVVHQDSGQFFDINGRMNVQGSVDLYGGADEMWMASTEDAELMIGPIGIFTVRDLNIRMEPTDYGFTFFGSGTIRCYHDWIDHRGVFNPFGGAVEFLGDANSTITAHPNSNFHTLRIAKTSPRAGSGSPESFRLRNGAVITRLRNAEVSLSACVIKGGLDIVSANTVTVNGDVQSLNQGTNVVSHATLVLAGHTFTSTGLTFVGEDGTFICQPNSTIQVGADEQFVVFRNGIFRAPGTVSGPVTFTVFGTGGYHFIVMETSTFAASYATFQYLGSTGIVFQNSPTLEYFDHCVFTNGTPGGRFISFYGPGSYTISNASFPTNPGSNAYGTAARNVYRASEEGHVYFSGWSGTFGGPDFEDDANNRVWWSGGSGIPPVEDISLSYVPALNVVRLDWSYPFPATQFIVERSPSPDGPFSFYTNTTLHTLSQTPPGPRYFYRVKAVGP